MATYHAYANSPELHPGTVVLVTGGSERVTINNSDELSIEAPGRHRVAAHVSNRRGPRLILGLLDGTAVWLELSDDSSAFNGFKISDGFSRQHWVVVRRSHSKY